MCKKVQSGQQPLIKLIKCSSCLLEFIIIICEDSDFLMNANKKIESFGFIGIQERFSLELKTKLSRIDFEIPESCKVFIQCLV